jgi:hypothetical protein
MRPPDTNRFLAFPALAFALLAFVMVGCEVDQTQEGEMPDVDVDVETDPGRLPAYDVDWANVDVGTTTRTVEVPEVRVVMVEEQVEVPVIDVNMPDDVERYERTITVESEIAGTDKEIAIEEIYAVGDRLIVISRLNDLGTDLGDEIVRVSDRVVLNAPDMDVRHYIVGDRPSGEFNENYTYLRDRNDIADRLRDGRQIY